MQVGRRGSSFLDLDTYERTLGRFPRMLNEERLALSRVARPP